MIRISSTLDENIIHGVKEAFQGKEFDPNEIFACVFVRTAATVARTTHRATVART